MGGVGNSDGGISNIGMYGNGLIATIPVPGTPSSFWVDTLVAPSIPLVNTVPAWILLPPGALYYSTVGGLGVQQVFVK